MGIILFVIVLVSTSVTRLDAQVSYYGLTGYNVTTIAVMNETLYVGTKDSGVHCRSVNDTNWMDLGLEGKWIMTISTDSTDDSGVVVLAGVNTLTDPPDSPLIYRYSQNSWTPDDEGIDTHMTAIYSIHTMITYGGDHRTFSVGDAGPIHRRIEDVWLTSSDFNIIGLLIQSRKPNEVWCSGQSGFGDPLLRKSTDLGDTWVDILDPNIFTSYIYSLVFPDSASPFFFAGTPGVIWKSDEVSWDSVLKAPCNFIAMAVNPFDSDMIFAGGYCAGLGRLFQSSDGGTNWNEIALPESLKGITALDVSVQDSLGLFIATSGDGVYRYAQPSETAALTVRAGWNLISVPRLMANNSVNDLLPSAISQAFSYEAGYHTEDTLANGVGYWVKFRSPQVIPFTGPTFNSDTIDVQPGWNIVGALSHTISVNTIQSIPSGIVTSQFYGYQGQYSAVTALKPGHGYWVKVSEGGMLILSR